MKGGGVCLGEVEAEQAGGEEDGDDLLKKQESLELQGASDKSEGEAVGYVPGSRGGGLAATDVYTSWQTWRAIYVFRGINHFAFCIAT